MFDHNRLSIFGKVKCSKIKYKQKTYKDEKITININCSYGWPGFQHYVLFM